MGEFLAFLKSAINLGWKPGLVLLFTGSILIAISRSQYVEPETFPQILIATFYAIAALGISILIVAGIDQGQRIAAIGIKNALLSRKILENLQGLSREGRRDLFSALSKGTRVFETQESYQLLGSLNLLQFVDGKPGILYYRIPDPIWKRRHWIIENPDAFILELKNPPK